MKTGSMEGESCCLDVYFDDGRVARLVGRKVASGFVVFTGSPREWKVPEGTPITDEEKEAIIVAFREAAEEMRKESEIEIILE